MIEWNGHGTATRWQDARREATRRAMMQDDGLGCFRGVAVAGLLLLIVVALAVVVHFAGRM